MLENLVDLMSTAAAVAVVGLAAIALLLADLVRRELAGPRHVAGHYRGFGVAMTVAFVALATWRFVALGA